MFHKDKTQYAAPYYQPQHPSYYPPPPQPIMPVPFGNIPPPSYPYPQPQNNMNQQPTPRPWFRITKEEVRNLANDQQILAISRQSAINMPKELSSKSSVALTRPDGSLLGTIKFHSLSSSEIDFSVNGNSSKLSDPYMMGDRFTFKPLCRGAVTTLGSAGEKWYWKLKDHTNAVLKIKSSGEVIARIEDGALVFERPGMSHAECDEILVTAVAVLLKGNRNKKDEGIIEGVLEVLGAA